jgi:predicted nucleic acid-binding protein
MPERMVRLVTNTTPLISITAAMGDLDVLRFLYQQVVVPFEVAEEIRVGGKVGFAVDVFQQADWLDIQPSPVKLSPFLSNALDKGEAAVIQTAMDLNVPLVCIDEVVGRRMARLCNLTLTGSIGVLLKAQQLGYPLDMAMAIQNMQSHGIWLSEKVIAFALSHNHKVTALE